MRCAIAIRPFAIGLVTSAWVAAFAACPPAGPKEFIDDKGRHPGAPPAPAKKIDAVFDGKLRLLGADMGNRTKPGSRVEIKLQWQVEGTISSDPRVFVHVAAPNVNKPEVAIKHTLVKAGITPAQWRKGDVIVDAFDVRLPKDIDVNQLVVYVGVFEFTRGDERRLWPVSPDSAQDKRERVEIGKLAIAKGKDDGDKVDDKAPAAPELDVGKRKGAIKIDGVADEADWKTATVFPFAAHDGKSAVTRKTTAKMLWDNEALYVSFDVEDPDAFTTYSKRDDPIYDSEATEIFIDADGDKDEYVELQAASDDLHFDAAFKGGPRKGMDKSWNSPFETKTKKTDKGYVSEWKIPVASLKDIPAGEPKAGARWKINLFRLERIREGTPPAKDAKITKHEASAWSPPLTGDFHTLDRFGTITFK